MANNTTSFEGSWLMRFGLLVSLERAMKGWMMDEARGGMHGKPMKGV
jgi:hypothetical protein